MRRFWRKGQALLDAIAIGSILALLGSCSSNDETTAYGLSETNIAMAEQGVVGKLGALSATPLWYTPGLSAFENCTAPANLTLTFGDPSGQSVNGTDIDSANNIYIAGSNQGTLNFGGMPLATAGSSDIFVAKFDSAGNHLWSNQFGDASPQNATGARVDSAGNVVVVGLLDGTANFGGGPLTTAGLLDVLLFKLDANGNHVWSKRFGDSNTQNGSAVAIDSANNIVIVGNFQGGTDFGGGTLTSAGATDIFVAKFDPSGNHVWSKRFGNASGQNANAVAVDASGNVFLTGLFAGAMSFGGATLTSAGGNDIYLVKLDASGNHVWSKSFGTATNDVPRGVAADNGGNVVITGLVTNAIDFGGGILPLGGGNDGFVAKFDASGNHVWSKLFGDAGSQIFISAATDSSNNIIIGGQFTGAVDMGGGAFTSLGSADAIVAKFAPNGTHIWSQSFGSTDTDVPQALTVDHANNVVLAGDFRATIDFGNGPINNAGATDAFVVRYVPCVPVALGGSCMSNGNCGSGYCDPAGNICACDQNTDCIGTQVCNTVANPNVCTLCGNGMLDGVEGCDDGNFINGDGCNSTCLREQGQTCPSDNVCATGFCTNGVCCQSPFCFAQDQCHLDGSCQPGSGTCAYPNKTDGSSCNDNDACTQSDTCQSGTCTGANPVSCTASDQCHDAGTCNPMTGLCSNPNKTDGTSCNDNDACTQSDTCQSGACTGANPVSCTASDQCHDAGTCNPMTGLCSNPSKTNGTSCNDNDACTQSDTCQSGTCTGANPVSCTASDQCHDVGTCNPMTGLCSNPNKTDGTSCNDNDACTPSDTCQSGTCTGANPVSCTAMDQCHDVGTCDPMTGMCSNPSKTDGTTCNDNNACTQSDTCQSGTCTGANPITCAAPNECETAGGCNAATGSCENIAKADGTACSIGTCQKGACIAECNVDADCGELFECTRFHRCQPLTEGPLDALPACACSSVGVRQTSLPYAIFPILALGALRLRRRRS